MKRTLALIVVFALFASFSCAGSSQFEGADWPQWGGPYGNFTSSETGYDPYAFADGVDILWEADVGVGHSSVAINDGWLYTLGELETNKTSAYCINAKTGRIRWKVPVQTEGVGTQGSSLAGQTTPVVDGELVYIVSPSGEVLCLAARNGKLVWSVSIEDSYDLRKATYGFASSPIVYDGLVLIHANNLLVALDKKDGTEVWHHRDEDDRLEYYGIYSTPFSMSIDGNTYLIRKGHGQLEAYAIESGELIAVTEISTDGAGSTAGNINDGIVDGTRILNSGIHGKGEMFRFNGSEFTSVWQNGDVRIPITPYVLVNEYLYGFAETFSTVLGLVCIDASNGRQVWRKLLVDKLKFSQSPAYGGVTVVDNIFFLLTRQGTLITADLSASGYNELSRGQLPAGFHRTPAVVSGGRLFARNQSGTLYCVDVAAENR